MEDSWLILNKRLLLVAGGLAPALIATTAAATYKPGKKLPDVKFIDFSPGEK